MIVNLAAIVDKRGAQQQWIRLAAMHKRVKYIKAVALIEVRHPFE